VRIPESFVKGSVVMPKDNDSPYLLDMHERGLQNLDRMAKYPLSAPVDLVVVGAGAGGVTLAQRLARAGWRIVILEKGPFWDPDRDWVSDEKGSAGLYWNDIRIISGDDPIEMGKNNSGVGVGGSMTHFAGYTPRFHPSDFEVKTRDGVAVDWPISYWDLKESFERIELELPVAGQDWPWGDPHSYPHGPHPIAGAASVAWQGARNCGIEMRVGPVSITNGVFGNRPHCIYRGFCLQGCKVNAKASPLITHLPDAIEYGVEVRANCMATRVEIDEATGRCTGVTYVDEENSAQLALQRFHALGYDPKKHAALEYIWYAGVDLLNEPEKLLEDAQELEPALVIVDSLSRVALGIKSENDNAEMSRLMKLGVIPIARETNAGVVLVHHTSATGTGPRGATAIRNSADQVISIIAAEDKTKAKTGTLNIFPSKPRRKTAHIAARITGDIEADGWARVERTDIEEDPF